MDYNMRVIIYAVLFGLSYANLLGSYLLFHSYSDGLYDFSGNERHAEVLVNSDQEPILTDRGLFLTSKSSIKFPSNLYNKFPDISSMSVSIWFLPTKPGTLISLSTHSVYRRNKVYIDCDAPSVDGLSRIKYYNHQIIVSSDEFISFCNIQFRQMEFYISQALCRFQ